MPAHDILRGSTDTDSRETSIRSDKTHQRSICSTVSTSIVFQSSSVDQQVMDQFAEMKTMFTSFLGPRQETTSTAFCNFQNFRNEAVKLLSLDTEQDRGKELSASATYTSQELQYHFRTCANDFSPAAASAMEYACIFQKPRYQHPRSYNQPHHTQVVPRGQQQPRMPQTS